jgi:hypothetical protein
MCARKKSDSEENSTWEYKPGDPEPLADDSADSDTAAEATRPSRTASFSWTASEFIEHQHPAGWYSLLVLITAALAVGVYFLTKDYFATGTIVILGFIVWTFAGHKPRQITYELTSSGLKVGDKTYSYGLFKSYFIVREGGLSSINLVPLKRFTPPISAFFAGEDEVHVQKAIGDYLPYEERQLDGIDRLSRRLRL